MKHIGGAFFAMVALLGTATPAHAQTECTVVSTYFGRWSRVELNCGGSPTDRPRVGVVQSEALRACPLLLGDRVTVTYQNNDPTRRPEVTAVRSRGDGGPSSGDWCNRAFPPGRYSGPCLVMEDPPWNQRADTVGASWVRRSVDTWLRDSDDNRQSIGPSGCGPAELRPGVYRIYVEESIRRAIWKPSPTFFADRRVIEDVTRENHHYEGGIYVDGKLARVDSVTDLSPLVRGWGGLGLIAQSPKAAPAGGSSTAPPKRTSPLSMTGLHTMRTRSLSVTGLRAFHVTSMTLVGLRALRASPVSMSGVRVIETTRLQITGVRRLRTQTIMMTGYRLPP